MLRGQLITGRRCAHGEVHRFQMRAQVLTQCFAQCMHATVQVLVLGVVPGLAQGAVGVLAFILLKCVAHP